MSTEIAVRLEGVTKRYGPVTALDGAGFQLRRGETVALLGPRGAGKTTSRPRSARRARAAGWRPREPPRTRAGCSQPRILQLAGIGDSGWPRCRGMAPSRS